MESYSTPFPLDELARSLSALPSVGPATARALAERGLRTWGDAMFFFPLRYEDRRNIMPLRALTPGQRAVVRGNVLASSSWGRRRQIWRIVLADQSGRVTCLWFNFRKSQMEGYQKGRELILVGEVEKDRAGGLFMAHPLIYDPAEAKTNSALGRVVPIYPYLEGVADAKLQRIMQELIERVAPHLPDFLWGLLPIELYPQAAGQALLAAHQPGPQAQGDELNPTAGPWLKSLAVNELLYFELGLALQRRQREAAAGRPLSPAGKLLERYLAAQSFQLKSGQQVALEAIRTDLSQSHPMGRLLCGDVGTGKTVVAVAAACLAVEARAQVAFMAPTEVLAQQHHTNLVRDLEPLGIKVALALGSMNGAAKRLARLAAAQEADLVVGTHALLSEALRFKDLGLVIIDEQQRFGVHQRLRLTAKGNPQAQPHLLVLSATPIPRTLALALAGHLEISDLPQHPYGQSKVTTNVLAYDQRRQALEAIAQNLRKGQRAYVICPLVEASEAIEAQDVIQTHVRLANYFSEVRVGLLHGRMDALAQQKALNDFKSGATPLLVATTVVEVGVDVPEATLLVILAAERFGLSQLHQLRGRVGRGAEPGTCLLVTGPHPSGLAQERLKVLSSTSDGLAVAEADLHLRGPGEALGARQSGLPPFKVARWIRDADLVPPLREIIASWLQNDPGLANPALKAIKIETIRRWGRRMGLVESG